MPSMSLESNVRTRAVSDPLALRALAHPVRLQLYALVGREGTLTAAEASVGCNCQPGPKELR